MTLATRALLVQALQEAARHWPPQMAEEARRLAARLAGGEE